MLRLLPNEVTASPALTAGACVGHVQRLKHTSQEDCLTLLPSTNMGEQENKSSVNTHP